MENNQILSENDPNLELLRSIKELSQRFPKLTFSSNPIVFEQEIFLVTSLNVLATQNYYGLKNYILTENGRKLFNGWFEINLKILNNSEEVN